MGMGGFLGGGETAFPSPQGTAVGADGAGRVGWWEMDSGHRGAERTQAVKKKKVADYPFLIDRRANSTRPQTNVRAITIQ